MERDKFSVGCNVATSNFNSHAHVERDDFLWNADETKFHFNSHAHVERDNFVPFLPTSHSHFNSHAHVERDPVSTGSENLFSISTHTLTWSVTVYLSSIYKSRQISTHTLTWSVTPNSIMMWCDKYISTHTLTWSVTLYNTNTEEKSEQFQLTRSRGAWHGQFNSTTYKNNFNSHAHVERDFWKRQTLIIMFAFQLTRSRGAWQGKPRQTQLTFQFQLTRSRGAWHVWYKFWKRCKNFNSHAHVERDMGRFWLYFE